MSTTPEDLGIPWAASIIEYEDTGCWLWIGAWGARDYGVIQYQGHNTTAHRAIYQFVFGDISKDLVVDHLCKVHTCVNPDHLEAVPQSKNILRGDNPSVQKARHAAKTHCKNKHPLSGPNVKHAHTSGYLLRVCKTCQRDSRRRRRRMNKSTISRTLRGVYH